MKKNNAIATLLLFLVVGCQVGPRYHPPVPDAPEDWKTAYEEPQTIPHYCEWWWIFEDETLNSLEDQAIANNPTLYQAMDRIEQAWAQAGISHADLFPTVNFSPDFKVTKLYPKVNFRRPILPEGTVIPPSLQATQYGFPINMVYEIDLWGKYRQNYESKVDNAEAVEEAYKTALLSLTANVAAAYFNLRTLDATIVQLEKIILTHEREYQLNLSRYENGIVTYIDVGSALTNLSNSKADYDDALRQRGLQENLLATLIGVPATDFMLDQNPLCGEPPVIPPALPSVVMLQRPDIAQAEREMASKHALIGVAYADLFPSFELTGVVEYLSLDLKHFLKLLTSLWSIGVGANQPIFDAGRRYFTIDAAWAVFKEASDVYKQQLLTAFQEVEDALTNLEFQRKQSENLAIATQAAQKTAALSKQRYVQGVVNYVEVVTYERIEFNDEVSYIRVMGDRYQSTIQLIKALGGSWKNVQQLCIEE